MSITRIGVAARYSNIVKYNGIVYLCGQVADDEKAPIIAQTTSMLKNVDDLLIQAGSSRERILSATIYLKNMKDYDAMNSVWDNWVPAGHSPARACVEAALAEEELLVEISVVAAENQ